MKVSNRNVSLGLNDGHVLFLLQIGEGVEWLVTRDYGALASDAWKTTQKKSADAADWLQKVSTSDLQLDFVMFHRQIEDQCCSA